MRESFCVAIVGATGAVGGEFLRLFEQRKFPISSLTLLASERSVGKQLTFDGKQVEIKEAKPGAFTGVDVAFFSAGASRSKALVPDAIAAGSLVINNSSAFRMDPTVPLIVPEVNPSSFTKENRLFSVGNCTAILLCVAINPLRKLGKLNRIIVSTYQSASGGGAGMMRQLEAETKAIVCNEELPPTS